MKKPVALFVWLLAAGPLARAQASPPVTALTLAECQNRAQQNYPLVRQRALIQKTRDYSVANASKGYVPQVTITGSATYQNETVSLAQALPDNSPVLASLPQISKDQYRLTAQVDQALYDGGTGRATKQLRQADADVQQQQVEVSLYTLRERVNQVFFGVLVFDAQRELTELRRADLQQAVSRTQAQLANGTAYRSSVSELQAEVVGAEQRLTELRSNRRAYLTMLGLLINQPLDEQTTLATPTPTTLSSQVNRPELGLYTAQERSVDAQLGQLRAGYRPKLSAFAQGNYGRPTFNIVDNSFGVFWIAGVRLNWNITSLYTTRRNDVQLLDLSRQGVDVQRATFLFNTDLTLTQQRADAQRYQELLAQDQRIVELRESVKTAAQAQLQNGVITAHELVTKVNDESEARQTQRLHQIQLLQAQYAHQTTSGN